MVVKAFRFDDAEIGGSESGALNATDDKTAQRFFRGERVAHDTADDLVRRFGKALYHSGVFGRPTGSVRIGDNEMDWETVYVEAISAHAKMWDMDFWRAAEVFPKADRRLVALTLARQVVIELSLRYVALFGLGEWGHPNDETPWWATERCFGSFLQRIEASCPTPPSGSELVSSLKVDDTTVGRWFSGNVIPDLAHVDALARAFAKETPNGSEERLLVDFRRAAGIAGLVEAFRGLVGAEAVDRLGRAMGRFVGWALERAGEEPADDEERNQLAEIMMMGTLHPGCWPVLEDWANREREMPWPDDIRNAHPVLRAERVKHCLRIVGDRDQRQAELEEAARLAAKMTGVSAKQSRDQISALSELAAWHMMSSQTVSLETAYKIASGELKTVRVSGPVPFKAGNRMEEARRAAEAGDFKAACRHAGRAVHLVPDNAKYRYFYGGYLWQAGRFSEALEHLERACELKPDWDRPYVEIAIAYFNWGRADQAVHHLETGPEEMRGHSAFYQFTLADMLFRSAEDFAGALEDAETAISIDDQHAEAYELAAHCAFMLGDRR